LGRRLVFKGRLLADGMWVVHLLWGSWTAGSLAAGLWLCWASTLPARGAKDFRGALALVGLLFLLLGLVMFVIWRRATRAVVLRPDGLQFRPGLVRSVLVPYREVSFLGLGLTGGLVLEYEHDTRRGRMRRTLYLPRWVASHAGFREELRRRAPGAEVVEEGLRQYALNTFVGAVFGIWLTVGVGLSPVVYVPSWKMKVPWLGPWVLGGMWLAGLVALWGYQVLRRRGAGGVVFRGRLMADGVWLTHVIWGTWALGCLGFGLWLCWLATRGVRASAAAAFTGLLITATGLVLLDVWRIAVGTVVLRSDGLWCRPGFVRSVLVPYDDMVFLGPGPAGVVLAWEKARQGARVRARLYLPPWVLTHAAFREELKRRAPRLEMSDDRLMRLWAFRSRAGAVQGLWLTALVPLVFFLSLPPLFARVSPPALLIAGGVWVAVQVGLIVWRVVGERRLAGQCR